MDEYTSIFVESTEDMGIQFDSYELLLGQTNTFLDLIEKFIDKLNKDPDTVDIDLGPDIKEYKTKALVKCKAKPIELKKIRQMMKKIMAYQSKLTETLHRYAKIKDSIAYGGNFTRAILKRPKVYSKEINEEKYAKINEEIRSVNRAMDWVEKVLIDLYNLTDQDLNILEIVNVTYNKTKIYESYKLPGGVVNEDVADSVIPMNPSAIDEASWHNATMDKKTGSAAPYIKRNHDMANYGEDDVDPADYKRPSAQQQSEENDDSDDEKDDSQSLPATTDDNIPAADAQIPDTKPADSTADKGGVKNYYYYTYTNSLNKTHTDDHSTHNKTINDDHSTGKHINSDNGLSAEDIQKIKKDDGMYHKLESAAPWELDLGIPEPMMESQDSVFTEARAWKKKCYDHFHQVVVLSKKLAMLIDKRYDANTPAEQAEIDKEIDKLGKIITLHQNKIDEIREAMKAGVDEEDPANVDLVEEFDKLSEDFIHAVTSHAFGDSQTKDIHDKLDRMEQIFKKFKIVITESAITEEVGDADDMKPESDHPVKDIAMDIDRKTAKMHQKAKKAVQDTMNAGRAIAKPINRTKDWISNMVVSWRDADETKVKERMADPQQRKGLLNAIRKAIRIGALAKAGLLFNPIILFLTVTKKIGDNKKSYRIRNEMIGELKTEMEVIDEKIKDADAAGDKNAKYKLMRFKNEINKKLLRVGGGTRWDKVI